MRTNNDATRVTAQSLKTDAKRPRSAEHAEDVASTEPSLAAYVAGVSHIRAEGSALDAEGRASSRQRRATATAAESGWKQALRLHGREKYEQSSTTLGAQGRHGGESKESSDCVAGMHGSLTLEEQSSRAELASTGNNVNGGEHVLGQDMLLADLRAWLGGLERIADADQLAALLTQQDVSLATLALLTVDELAATGIGEDAARNLLTRITSRTTLS